uniref:Uncharacterized LOC113474223 n=1 Tax=Ciona intestinalis TaxID=7719 RepID=H2XJZ6_CIOIN|nr:uncharacterized protein LOC113474223 [Ciona intestinalis]|eukprot:XP_026690221.1 uncharacterized protein LOC113474223 [Ciona intestinalis]
MKVICAGAPKTGTKSIAQALRLLGYDTVYDVEEATEFAFEEWENIFFKKVQTFNDVMKTYCKVDAVVDVPHSLFFDEFLKKWPDAKVILMLRNNEEDWFKSFEGMVNRASKEHGHVVWFTPLSAALRRMLKWQEKLFLIAFGGFEPHSIVWKSWYRRHNAYVRETVPSNQLLEYKVTEGWKPLCEFLNRDIPDEEFPFENKAGIPRNIATKMMEDTWIAKRVKYEIKRSMIILSLVVAVGLYCFF